MEFMNILEHDKLLLYADRQLMWTKLEEMSLLLKGSRIWIFLGSSFSNLNITNVVLFMMVVYSELQMTFYMQRLFRKKEYYKLHLYPI